MPKSEPKNPGKTIPIMDVAHPGKSAPAANSKSVIVSNRPIMKDPMVVDGAGDTEEVDRLVEADRPIEKATPKLEPLATPDTAADNDNKESDKPAEPDTPDASDKPDQPSEPTTDKPDKTSSDNEGKSPAVSKQLSGKADKAGDEQLTEAAASDTPEAEAADDKDTAPDDKATKDTKDTKAAEAAADQAAKHHAAIDKLADSQQYYVPINSVEKRRSQRFVGLGILLSLLLVVAWADIALDAGIVSNSANLPHTHFFDRSSVSAGVTVASTSTPVSTSKTYTAPISQLSFQYPDDWTLTNNNQGGESELFTLLPPSESNTGNTASFFSVSFSNIAGTSPGSYSVLAIRYTKLPKMMANLPVYMRELVYKSQASGSNIDIQSGLVNDNLVKVGDTLPNVDPKFTSPGGFPTMFNIYAFGKKQGQPFVSLADAQTFMKSSNYQEAKKILLSVVPTKS